MVGSREKLTSKIGNVCLSTTQELIIRETFRHLLHMVSQLNNSREVAMVCDNFTYGEWFVLYLIKLNVNTRTCSKLISRLAADREKTINKEKRAYDGMNTDSSNASSTLELAKDKLDV